jgi:hypothetical protein
MAYFYHAKIANTIIDPLSLKDIYVFPFSQLLVFANKPSNRIFLVMYCTPPMLRVKLRAISSGKKREFKLHHNNSSIVIQ